jgi:hypothetical protein
MRTQPVIAIGVVNMTTGMTSHKWSIYENGRMEAYLTDGSFLIIGAQGSFQVGDAYDLVGDQTRRSLGKRGVICGKAFLSGDDNGAELIAMLKKSGYDYTPLRAFQKRPAGNRKLSTSYVLK